MSYNVKNVRNGKSMSKTSNGQVRGWQLYDGLNFKITKKICMEKVAGEQDLALQQHFPQIQLYPLDFLKFKLTFKLTI